LNQFLTHGFEAYYQLKAENLREVAQKGGK
jgi:hypothetical protein